MHYYLNFCFRNMILYGNVVEGWKSIICSVESCSLAFHLVLLVFSCFSVLNSLSLDCLHFESCYEKERDATGSRDHCKQSYLSSVECWCMWNVIAKCLNWVCKYECCGRGCNVRHKKEHANWIRGDVWRDNCLQDENSRCSPSFRKQYL